jgi:hypothetical protein
VRFKTGVLVALLVSPSLSTSVVAAVPSFVNFSGQLANASGAPLHGTFSVEFKIYTSSTPFLPAIWSEIQLVTTDAQGRFHVLLGSDSPLTDAEFTGAGRWLGITVESDPEISPRTRLVSVPYAFRLSTVDGATGGKISGSLATGANQAMSGGSNFLAGDSNTASGYASSVTAGISNTAEGPYSVVSGGRGNSSEGTDAVIVGGSDNVASGARSFIGAGIENLAMGANSMICGGWANEAAGSYSFAGGHHAKASESRTFVWNGNSSFAVADSQRSDGAGSVTMRAPGGYRFFSGSGTTTTGAALPVGSGSWSSMSDRNAKENLVAVDGEELLARLSLVPISKWNYSTQDDAICHIGPMAQDFYAAFGVGESDTHISNVDADGVALAAIQELTRQIRELKAEIERLKEMQ